jgi:hypothetical protein
MAPYYLAPRGATEGFAFSPRTLAGDRCRQRRHDSRSAAPHIRPVCCCRYVCVCVCVCVRARLLNAADRSGHSRRAHAQPQVAVRVLGALISFSHSPLHTPLRIPGDCALFELARRFFGRAVAWQALLCQVVSWSYCYCMARPLAVSLETCLTSTALALWPWEVTVLVVYT